MKCKLLLAVASFIVVGSAFGVPLAVTKLATYQGLQTNVSDMFKKSAKLTSLAKEVSSALLKLRTTTLRDYPDSVRSIVRDLDSGLVQDLIKAEEEQQQRIRFAHDSIENGFKGWESGQASFKGDARFVEMSLFQKQA